MSQLKLKGLKSHIFFKINDKIFLLKNKRIKIINLKK